MGDEHTSFDIAGQEVNLRIPEGAVITGAVVIATYQRIDEDGQAAAGSLWGISPIPMVQAVGHGAACTDGNRGRSVEHRLTGDQG